MRYKIPRILLFQEEHSGLINRNLKLFLSGISVAADPKMHHSLNATVCSTSWPALLSKYASV